MFFFCFTSADLARQQCLLSLSRTQCQSCRISFASLLQPPLQLPPALGSTVFGVVTALCGCAGTAMGGYINDSVCLFATLLVCRHLCI